MRPTKTMLVALATPAVLLALAACDDRTTTQAEREGAAIGQKSDAALAEAGDKLKQAGREARQKLAEASARTQQTLEHGAEKLRRATVEDSGGGGSREAARGAASTTSGGAGASRDARWGDAAITASIKADFLKDPDLSVFKIDVDTKDGVVTLNGLAQDDAARKRAESLAQGIKGVREVRNHLVLKKT